MIQAQRLSRSQVQVDTGQPVSAVVDPVNASLRLILQIERDARRAGSVRELFHLMANETRRAVGARQVFVMSGAADRLKVEAVSSLSTVEAHSPTIVWIERQTEMLLSATRTQAPDTQAKNGPIRARLDMAALAGAPADIYPFPDRRNAWYPPMAARSELSSWYAKTFSPNPRRCCCNGSAKPTAMPGMR